MTEVKATQKRLASADGHSWANIDCKGRESTATSTVLSVTLTAIANNRAIRAVMIFSLLSSLSGNCLLFATSHISAPLEQRGNAPTQLQHLLVPAPSPLDKFQHLAQSLRCHRVHTLITRSRVETLAQRRRGWIQLPGFSSSGDPGHKCPKIRFR